MTMTMTVAVMTGAASATFLVMMMESILSIMMMSAASLTVAAGAVAAGAVAAGPAADDTHFLSRSCLT